MTRERQSATHYRSFACHLGAHRDCTESRPPSRRLASGVRYETCHCDCHRAPSPGRTDEEQGGAG